MVSSSLARRIRLPRSATWSTSYKPKSCARLYWRPGLAPTLTFQRGWNLSFACLIMLSLLKDGILTYFMRPVRPASFLHSRLPISAGQHSGPTGTWLYMYGIIVYIRSLSASILSFTNLPRRCFIILTTSIQRRLDALWL